MNDEWGKICKEAVMAYGLRKTTKTSVRIASLWAEI
jgi:hypothetical protein